MPLIFVSKEHLGMNKLKVKDVMARMETLLELKWKQMETIELPNTKGAVQYETLDRMLLEKVQMEFDNLIKAFNENETDPYISHEGYDDELEED